MIFLLLNFELLQKQLEIHFSQNINKIMGTIAVIFFVALLAGATVIGMALAKHENGRKYEGK